MLEFEPYSLDALVRMLPYIRRYTGHSSDISAGSLFMWHEGIDVRFCVWHDTFMIRQNTNDQASFSWPVGPEADAMIDELIGYVRENHLPLRFFAVGDEQLETVLSDKRLQPARWGYNRTWSDYVYSFEEAAEFRGRKFSGQRNHINKYRKLYGEPAVRFLQPEDRPALDAMIAQYEAEHRDGNLLEKEELDQTKKVLDACGQLGFYVAGLMDGDRIAAFSVGEVLGDTLLIHVEKALSRYEGAYPAMYNGFVRLMAEHLGHPLKWINREDDSGNPGLRTSKQQYHPVMMANKNLVHVGTPALKMPEKAVLRGEKVVLTEFRGTDKPAYLTISTDIENNKWWGYDYRDDMDLTLPVDENLFYDDAQHDMQVGDSINFAVRLAEGGPMIGEGILWNFTYDGSAEIGCRIVPDCHGKGYGTDAFRVMTDFAAGTLGLRCNAKSCTANEAARQMILAGGYRETGLDEEYRYYEYPEKT